MLESIDIACPHCGAPNPLVLDTSSGPYETVEDCTVCCRPMRLVIDCKPGELRDVFAEIC